MCACGCGQLAKPGKKYIHGHNPQFKAHYSNNKNLKGKNNPSWKGGRKINNGYVYVLCPNHPNADSEGRVGQHRLVMESYLGRYLEKGKTRSWDEIPHHINGIKHYNNIENLELCLDKTHRGFHNLKLKHTEETKEKIRIAALEREKKKRENKAKNK